MEVQKKKLISLVVVSFLAFVLGHIFIEMIGLSIGWHIFYAVFFLGLFIKSTSEYNNVFVFRVIIPVVIGLGMVCLYRYVHTIPSLSHFLEASKSSDFYLERLFEVLSTLYAVCTAFLLWKGLTDHDNIRQVLKDEAGQMQSILGYLNYLEGDKNVETAKSIKSNFSKYLTRIKQGDSIASHSGNFELLSDTRKLVAKLDNEDHNDSVAISEIIRGLNTFFRIRMKRISSMETKLSPYILIALGFMSLSLLYVIFTEKPSDVVVVDTIVFILATLLSFMLMMLMDISQPFAGYWAIKLDAFSEIQKIVDDSGDL